MIREYDHEQDCQRIVRHVQISDATREEEEAAKEAVRKALAALPIGASTKELEKAREAAVTPYKAVVAQRKEKSRLELEKQTKRRAAEWKADLHLDHIARYLANEFDLDPWELSREAERLRHRAVAGRVGAPGALLNPDDGRCVRACAPRPRRRRGPTLGRVSALRNWGQSREKSPVTTRSSGNR